MDIANVHDRFLALAKPTIGVDIHAYLKETEKSLYGLLIVNGGKSICPMFGDPPEVLIDAANSKPIDALAGFCVNAGDALQIDIKADVFLLSEILLDETENQIDAIFVHELTHFAIDSENDDTLKSEITKEDRKTAAKLYSRTDHQMECVTRHNEYFCQILTVACRRWSIDRNDLDTHNAIELAMKFDVDGGFRQ